MEKSDCNILIKNGQIVNADKTVSADVLVENGKITQIGKNLKANIKNCQTIDATNLLIMPGGIDPHTHFEMDFMDAQSIDDFYTGSKAAIAGGTTMYIDFALPKLGQSLIECYNKYRKNADAKTCCDYTLHMCVTWWSDQVKEEMKKVTTKEYGLNSFKMFMAYNFALNDAELFQSFDVCREVGGLAMVHAENSVIADELAKKLLAKGINGPEGHELSRPEEIEAEAVFRSCTIANQVDCPLYVVHVMSESAANIIKNFRQEGKEKRIFGETLASAIGLVWEPEKYKTFEEKVKFIMSPPIRPKKSTPTSLLKHLASDVLSAIGSDNCTFNCDKKSLGKNDFRKIPCGVNGVEDRLTILWEKGVNSGIMNQNRFVDITSTSIAKLFNLYPRKGCIAVGSDADILIWNPNKSKTISAKTHHLAIESNIFEGFVVHGAPEYVIVNGKICFCNGKLNVEKGYGKFVPANTFAEYIYGK